MDASQCAHLLELDGGLGCHPGEDFGKGPADSPYAVQQRMGELREVLFRGLVAEGVREQVHETPYRCSPHVGTRLILC